MGARRWIGFGFLGQIKHGKVHEEDVEQPAFRKQWVAADVGNAAPGVFVLWRLRSWFRRWCFAVVLFRGRVSFRCLRPRCVCFCFVVVALRRSFACFVLFGFRNCVAGSLLCALRCLVVADVCVCYLVRLVVRAFFPVRLRFGRWRLLVALALSALVRVCVFVVSRLLCVRCLRAFRLVSCSVACVRFVIIVCFRR